MYIYWDYQDIEPQWSKEVGKQSSEVRTKRIVFLFQIDFCQLQKHLRICNGKNAEDMDLVGGLEQDFYFSIDWDE